jgi:hypothetical protein
VNLHLPILIAGLQQSIHSMPLAWLVPALMMLLAGLVLWAGGRRILRGAFMLMGLLLGLLIGLLVHDSWQPNMPGWVLPVIGGVALAVMAGMTYRLAAAAMMAIALGIVCPLSVMAVNEWQVERGRGISSNGDDQIEVRDSISDWIEKHETQLDQTKEELQTLNQRAEERLKELGAKHDSAEAVEAGIQQVKSFGAAVAQTIKQRWSETPKRLKPMMMLSAIVGAITGLIIGLVSRRFSDCAVTAMLGGAVWLGAAYIIALRAGVPDGPWLPKSMIVWLGAWLIIAIIGLGIQWARRGKPADKTA